MSQPLVESVPVGAKSWAAFRDFNATFFQAAQDCAATLGHKRIVHINSADRGGGVAELLISQVALERDLGLDSNWLVIRPPVEFFATTKHIHNLLQGAPAELSATEQALYIDWSDRCTKALADYFTHHPADLIICHDPQPLGAVARLSIAAPKILRLHPDICQPNPWIADWLCKHAQTFTQTIISRADCVLGCLPRPVAIPPAIDPLSPKNAVMPLAAARALLAQHGLDPTRLLISQISRFDKWKDPLGVIQAYQQTKRQLPELQLILVGFFQAADDPEAIDYFKQIETAAGDDPDIHLFSQESQLKSTTNDIFINAVQTASDVVLQKSTKEGFGLTVTEAMWKGKAVIAGAVGGILLQIESEQNGILVHDVPETAIALLRLLKDPALRKRLGAAAKKTAGEKFLMPTFVLNNLRVYQQLLASS